MKNSVLLLTVLSSVTMSMHLDLEWQTWKVKYEKKYSSLEEEQFRRGIWERTRQKVLEHNKLADEGKEYYWMETNHFADKTSKELSSKGCFLSLKHHKSVNEQLESETASSLAQSFDWRAHDCVTPVKSQGDNCNSCWIFSVVGTIESRYCIKSRKKELHSLSEQQVMDCGGFQKPCSCNIPEKAFQYINTTKYLMKDRDYPYTATKGYCQFKRKNSLNINLLNFTTINNEYDMALKVQKNGPILVGIDISHNFHLLRGKGIYDEKRCGGMGKHAMIIIGFGSENNKDYWIVKNSWGKNWGDNGYAKIQRGVGLCDITQYAREIVL